jgi:hypothetical protein
MESRVGPLHQSERSPVAGRTNQSAALSQGGDRVAGSRQRRPTWLAGGKRFSQPRATLLEIAAALAPGTWSDLLKTDRL